MKIAKPDSQDMDAAYKLLRVLNALDARDFEMVVAAIKESLKAATRDVLAERQRQISVEGWTPAHDDLEHWDGRLALAAASYAAHAHVELHNEIPVFWPWHASWWKPSTPRRDLVKAGALILAEIERIDRAAEKQVAP